MSDFITPPDHIHFLARKLFRASGEIIDGAIAYLEKGGGGPLTPHTHEHDHLFIVVSGQVKITTDTEEKILNPNESLLVKGNIPHAVWNQVDGQTIMIGISIRSN